MKDTDNSSILEELHHEEAELQKDEKLVKKTFIIFTILILAIIGVIAFLVYKFFTYKPTTTVYNKIIQIAPTSTVISPTKAHDTPSPSPAVANSTKTQTEASKDNYINIGYGSNTSGDWTDVAGAITTADIGQYQNIKEVFFEASINVPTSNGTVSVRLYNATDKHTVWNSEVTRNSTSDTYLFISTPLKYDVGPKLYQVQMKTQLNVAANLVQSRIHVVTK